MWLICLEAQSRLRAEVAKLKQGAEGAGDVHPEGAGEAGHVGWEVDAGVVGAMEPAPAGKPGPLAREELVCRRFLCLRGEEIGASRELHEPILDGGAPVLFLDLLACALPHIDTDMAVRGQQVAQAGVGELLRALVLEKHELRGG